MSPHNVHRNAARIHSVGADMTQLINAYCTELPPTGPHRNKHIAANVKLIKRAAGLLAALNGQERYASIGAGHTSAFCKTAEVGGKTTEKTIQDGDSNIDLHKLYKSDQYKEMITEGWEWFVIPHGVDSRHPKLAKIGPKALNGSNHVFTEVGELETAMMMAETIDEAEDMDEASVVALAVENVVGLCVPCASYAKTICEFVKLFGGGLGAPQVKFLDTVGKQFQCNVNLGSSFWHALTHTEFHAKASKFPLVRCALALGNLTSNKKEDGVAKFIVKSDITKIASKAKADVAELCENTLKEAIDIVDAISASEPDFDQKSTQAVGQLFVRVCMLATTKAKSSKEGKDYTMHEIKQLFLGSLGELLGTSVVCAAWNTAEKKQAQTSKLRKHL